MTPDDVYSQMKVLISNADTSENSYIYNALYPSASVYSYLSILMDQIENRVFASKAIISGYSDYLELRCAEIGIFRKQATYAMPPVTITGKVGTKISSGFIVSTNDNRQYTVSNDTIIGSDGTIDVTVKASDVGSLYNVKSGDINYIPVKTSGIVSVTNKEDYTDAYDKETDDSLYNRYLLKIQKPATSGNKQDYIDWISAIEGVGDVKVYPLTDENMQRKNGHVTCVIVDSNKQKASDDLIAKVQQEICPIDGEGDGEAPIGATVHIRTVNEVTINISVDVVFDSSTITLDEIKTAFIKNVNSYFDNTVYTTKKIVLRKIEAILIDISEVQDCSNLLINNGQDNITLSALDLAVLGTVTLNPIVQ
jgi:uncharacterized phage protein gp47/JayE